ncbi:MAG: peptide chain release factor N(5)-glutamine methyltransferase [Acidobacteria bacterium]|nr:peptide chain release factor N(5)-glutamine methyltransferase [Acidobacteriota bacterium]
MNVREALSEAIAQLTAAQVPSASTTAEVLLLHVLRRDRAFLYAHPEMEMITDEERAYRKLVAERAAGTPTQYLTGKQEFWGLTFQVEPGVFIPRPETEHVVEVALKLVRERLKRPDPRIADLGTGSGCIALALAAELPEAEIVATDVCEKALSVARRNTEGLGLAGRVQFVQSDLFEAFFGHHGHVGADFDNRAFDLVVSNPPYVRPEEADRLPREVREHEPPTALFSADEGLEVTRRLIEEARGALVPKGWLVLELGYGMAERVKALAGDAWTNVEVTNDLAGIPRVLAAQKKS